MGERQRMRARLTAVLVLFGLLGWAGTSGATDRHADYYYPSPQSTEAYEGRTMVLPESNRRTRVGFVTAVTAAIGARPYKPDFVVFAKGTDAEKLIIVGLDDGRYNSIYRIRALLASLTAMARTTPLFQDMPDVDNLTFLDLCHAMGFVLVTISDGARLTHQIEIR